MTNISLKIFRLSFWCGVVIGSALMDDALLTALVGESPTLGGRASTILLASRFLIPLAAGILCLLFFRALSKTAVAYSVSAAIFSFLVSACIPFDSSIVSGLLMRADSLDSAKVIRAVKDLREATDEAEKVKLRAEIESLTTNFGSDHGKAPLIKFIPEDSKVPLYCRIQWQGRYNIYGLMVTDIQDANRDGIAAKKLADSLWVFSFSSPSK